MIISESVEDYLESILVLQEKNGYVRSVDIANHLEISKASVSIAMKNEIKLTPTGLEIAKSVYEKHLMFSDFFYKLGVPKDIATRDACKIEHAVSKTTFNAIKSFVQKHSCELNSNNE